MHPCSLRAMLRDYLSHLTVIGYSPKTILDKEFCIEKFIEWCEVRDIHDVPHVTRDTIEKYQKHLYHIVSETTERNLSFYTQRARLSALSGYFTWLAKKGHIIYSPTAQVSLPRIGKHLPKNVLSIEEVHKVLNAPDVHTPLGIRDRAMFETFYSTAVRRSELINLLLIDLNSEQGVIMVRQGKGNKDRLIPIGSRALQWIDKYLEDVRPSLTRTKDSGNIFVTQYGEAFSEPAVSGMARRYFDIAGIVGRATCHALRHAAATHMLEAGADIRYIQEQLGHSDINTTTIYTKVSIRKLKEVHERCHRG